MLDFRWRHLSYIEQYVLRPSGSNVARGTGGTPAFAYLNQHITDTEAALLLVDEPIRHMYEHKEARPAEGETLLAASRVRLGPPPRHQLWVVAEERGLLPSAAPISSDKMPATWSVVIELVQQLPAACVPPATFRKSVVKRQARWRRRVRWGQVR